MPDVTVSSGIRLHYEERGSGEPLMLIMGLGAAGSLWEEHVLAYEQHFRCIMVDNRGAGESDKPDGPYTTKTMAQDVAGLMAALGIERARVAGISMGSAIAQELALLCPEKVRSLVLISSWAKCDRYTRTVFERFKTMRPLASPEDFVGLLQLWIAAPRYHETHADDLRQSRLEAAEGYMPLAAFGAQCDACIAHDTLDRLAQIEVPVLLTVGEQDIFTPLRLSLEMHELMPHSELLLFPETGHIHHWEDLQSFNAQTAAFLLAH